ncbi:MAG: sensor histidine kinase [Eubacterium sp.]|nr:sensor histidine kinase [Eubacterium sp.]
MLLCTISTLLALIVQTIFFEYSSSKQIYIQARDASINSMANMQDDISEFVKSVEDRMVTVYNQEKFISDLAKNMPLNDLRDKYGNELNYNLSHHMAISVFNKTFNVKAFYIYNTDNEIISTYRASYSPKYSYPADIFNDVTANNAGIVDNYVKSDNRNMLISSYYNVNRKEDIIRFVFKILYNNASKTIGYIVCDIDPKTINKIIGKSVYSNDQIVWLQAKGDRPIIKIGNMTEKQEAYYHHIVDLTKNNSLLIKNNIVTNGSEFFSIPNQKYNFIAFSLTPQKLLEANQQVLTRNLFIIAILLIFVFAVSSILLTRTITNPLTNMVETITKIKDGDTSLRVEKLKNDEIGKLGENFNNMLDTIETLIFEEYQSQIEINNAKYKALQAQVNPHFLYNTLETMSGIATSQNCYTVSTLCKALSNLFRYSLDMQEPLSTIEDEIKHLKNYIYIMNIRENNTISFEIDIDNSLLKESIPRISIQPLVENSIQHGLRNKRGNKKISIHGQIDNDSNIVISVSDNGIGMDADQINSQLGNPKFDALEKKSSIGISNINSRVKILFGSAYGVKVFSQNGEGSTVTLYIPHTKTEELKEAK